MQQQATKTKNLKDLHRELIELFPDYGWAFAIAFEHTDELVSDRIKKLKNELALHLIRHKLANSVGSCTSCTICIVHEILIEELDDLRGNDNGGL